MANLAPRSLFDEFFRDFAPGFFIRPLPDEAPFVANVRTEVREDERAYTLIADLPGVSKEDIQVSIDGNVVSLRAEIRREFPATTAPSPEEGDAGHQIRVLRSERQYGSVARSFSLPQEIDANGAQATYENGVLTLLLPKQAGNNAKQLTIK